MNQTSVRHHGTPLTTGGQAWAYGDASRGQGVDEDGFVHCQRMTAPQDVISVGVHSPDEPRTYAGESRRYPQSTGLITVINDLRLSRNDNTRPPSQMSPRITR